MKWTDVVSLALVDVWTQHDDKVFEKRMMRNYRSKLLPLYEGMKESDAMIFNCSSRESLVDGIPVHPSDPLKLFALSGNEIYYAGYASDMCLLFKPFGMIAAKMKGKDVVFVHDASISLEKDMHPFVVRLVAKNIGRVTTVREVLCTL